MTTTVDAPSIADAATEPRRRRWWIWALVVIVVAAAATPLVWWRVSVDQYQLSEGDVFSPGPTAAQNEAGPFTEWCYLFVPGQSIQPGFSISNDGGHTVTLTKVGRLFPGMDQSVTVDTNTSGAEDGRASAVRLPVTIRPGDNREIYLKMMPVAGATLPSNTSTTGNTVDLTFTVLGATHVQRLEIANGQVYITLSGVDPKKNTCDRFTPAPGNG